MSFTIVVFLSVVTLTWLFGVLVVPRFDRPRFVSPARVAVLRSDPVSTIHGDMSKKHSARTRAALAAATESLR